jgi:hypothetical protein
MSMSDGRSGARHNVRPVDPREFEPGAYVDRRGAVFRKKPGRRKKYTAEQAAVIFEALVQIRAMQRLIDRTLDVAGFTTHSTRDRAQKLIWRDRGRIDVLHPAKTPAHLRNVRRPGLRRGAN